MIADARGDEPEKERSMGSFAIEVTTHAMNNQLFFNPGINDEELE